MQELIQPPRAHLARHAALPLLWVTVALTALLGCQKVTPAESPTASPALAAASSASAPAAPPPPWSRPGYKRPGIIDFHGHLNIYGTDRLAAILKGNGIDRIVNLSGGSGRGGGRQWTVNRVFSRYFGDRILNAMNIDWRGFGKPGWGEREAGRLRTAVTEHGYVALKVSKALGLGAQDQSGKLVLPDDDRMAPLFSEAGRLGIPVCIHVADPKAFWQRPDTTNERYAELGAHPGWSYFNKAGVPSWSALLDASERLFKAHPKTIFVAVHFGNAAEELDRVDRMMTALPNMWIDISARVGEFGRHPPAKVKAFFLRHQDRVLFGTDIGISDSYLMLGSNGEVQPTMADVRPFYEAHFRYLEGSGKQIAHPSPIQGDWKVDAIALPDAVLNKLYRDNALRLLAMRSKAKNKKPVSP
ncbi:MAG: amidohydrolase family protein [Myxococcales bacterium]|nr:amidohydrolase family protein [Myxococcales bacterium]